MNGWPCSQNPCKWGKSHHQPKPPKTVLCYYTHDEIITLKDIGNLKVRYNRNVNFHASVHMFWEGERVCQQAAFLRSYATTNGHLHFEQAGQS